MHQRRWLLLGLLLRFFGRGLPDRFDFCFDAPARFDFPFEGLAPAGEDFWPDLDDSPPPALAAGFEPFRCFELLDDDFRWVGRRAGIFSRLDSSCPEDAADFRALPFPLLPDLELRLP